MRKYDKKMIKKWHQSMKKKPNNTILCSIENSKINYNNRYNHTCTYSKLVQ